MADLCNYKIFKNSNFEVLTPDGYKDFKGIIVGENINKLLVKFSNGKQLICTPKHKIVVDENLNYIYAKDLKVNDLIFNNVKVESISPYNNNELVYELLHVSDNHTYYTNGILSRQCLILDELAFIPNNLVDAFWKSVYPIISSSKKSKIFIASTPNGTDNLFYKLYMDGLNKKSNWYAEKMLWYEIPGRDEKWKQETIQSIGSEEAFKQEFDCIFLQSGDSFIDEEYFAKLENEIKEPKHIFDDGAYKIWEEPDMDCIYTIGVDVAEGVGKNNSAIQVLDITDLTNIIQVAEYTSNKINPFEFATKVHEICHHWGAPPVLIERNNSGGQVVDLLYQTYRYPNIVSYSPSTGKIKFDRLGVYAHTNTKYKGVINMRYWVHELKCVMFRSKETIEELRAFQRNPNGTWCAKPGYDDDRVMSLIWALMILDNALIQKYYDVIELDDNGKPKNIALSEFVHQKFTGFLNEYKTQNASDTWEPPSMVYYDINIGEQHSEIDNMIADGWEILQ